MGYNLISSSEIPDVMQSNLQKSPVLMSLNGNKQNRRQSSSIKAFKTTQAMQDAHKIKTIEDLSMNNLEHANPSAVIRELELKQEISEKKRKYLSKRVIDLAGASEPFILFPASPEILIAFRPNGVL
jgi:hypothetical protein